jgi:hypothetical protein
MNKKIEVGELLYRPRLEKTILFLHHRINKINEEHPDHEHHPIHVGARINSYIKLHIHSEYEDNSDSEEDDEDLTLTGYMYSIEIIRLHTMLCGVTIPLPQKEITHIVDMILKELDQYDIKNIFQCNYCSDVAKKEMDCCEECDIMKTTYHDMCSICQDDNYSTDPSIWILLTCNHVFHKHCIKQMDCCSDCNEIKCPLCRQSQHKLSFSIL